jgi:hypothetical protein
MRTVAAPALSLPALLVLATPAWSTVTYSHRDARFFGETSARETLTSGSFAGGTNTQLPVNFSTGGGTPTLFDALATTQASPFRLGVYNHVDAGANTALTFNTDFVTPTTIVSIVSSVIQENGVTITGGTGTGYLLPTFRIRGSFDDTHPTANGSLAMCAGVDVCTLSGVANSTGPADVDTTFTPAIGTSTDFTFDTPFTFFFFISASISSFTPGNLAPGEVTVDFTSGLELLSIQVVDANGDPIPGAVVDSEFLDILAVPEPGALGLSGLALSALILRRRRPSHLSE